jgi:hypothetical protein
MLPAWYLTWSVMYRRALVLALGAAVPWKKELAF